MASVPPDRRDMQGLISEIRVDVATIKERTATQTTTLAELKQKLELGVFREEYERRHLELEHEVTTAKTETATVRDDYLRRQGENRTWRWVFSAAVAILGLLEVFHPFHF